MIRTSEPISVLVLDDNINYITSKFEDVSLLLVEDNLINQKIVKALLKKWNIRVDLANDGIEGFEKAKNNHYDMILMDTHMPLMNGYEATRKIRSELDPFKKAVPIISFSASLTDLEKVMVFEAGVDDLVEKPFDIGTLHRKIKALICQNSMLTGTHEKIAS